MPGTDERAPSMLLMQDAQVMLTFRRHAVPCSSGFKKLLGDFPGSLDEAENIEWPVIDL